MALNFGIYLHFRPLLLSTQVSDNKDHHDPLVYTLASANVNQTAPNFVTVHMNISSLMSSIMDIIALEHPELFALELGKTADFDFVYTLASTNINQSLPDLVKKDTIIRSRLSSIIDLIGPELSELSVLELEKLPYLTLYTIQHLQI